MPRHLDAAEHAFQWPPEERAAGVKVFHVLDNGQLEHVEAAFEPVPLPATPAAVPDQAPNLKSARPLPASEPVGRQIAGAKTRKPLASNWLRAHHSELMPALIALVAVLEGVYILQVVPLRRGDRYLAPDQKTVATVGRTSVGASDKPRDGRMTLPSEPSRKTVNNGRPSGPSRVDPTRGAPNPLPRSHTTASPGWIAITSPLVLDVFEGEVLVGTTGSSRLRLPPGSHTLRLRNDLTGFERTDHIRVVSGQVSRVSIKLPEGLLHVNALPWAEVLVDGRHIGETPLGNLSLTIGPHEVIFRHPELGERTLSTVVKAGVLTRVTTDMRDESVR